MGFEKNQSQLQFRIVFVLLSLIFSTKAIAQSDAICAVVKIEIKQELTLERQAFDAEMRINNGLDDISLENVRVDVSFKDEEGNAILASSDPNHASASFFIRLANLDQLNAVDGTGTIAPGATAVANWLIIPAPGSATEASGTVYFVGATLSYDVNGEEEEVTVAPDRIVVKPLPLLTMDYFLQQEVIADDAFTAEIEPAQPFTLGVRVSNNGQATAREVKIDSAQPEIIENEQGLLIGFEIISSFVADQAAQPTLLLNLGDIEAQNARTGRWQMQTTLSGKFTEFSADFTHADELGGELTSILEATHTHLLMKDVVVDLPGRDSILDFLADDGDAVRVYESDNIDTEVNNQSSSASLSFVQASGGLEEYTLNFDVEGGLVYVKIADAYNFKDTRVVEHIIRSDGKRLSSANAWFSQTRNESNGFDHFFNIFDVNSTGQYTVIFAPKQAIPAPPVLQFIPDRQVIEGSQLSFLVEASDPNGTIPTVSVENLPAGAAFYLQNTNNGIATYIFDWTPSGANTGQAQAGRYEVNYIASDGVLSSNRRAYINVLSNNDSDGDGLDDQWELDNFGNLDRDGNGDFDGDGISDLDEFLNGTNPLAGPGTGPSVPVVEAPVFGTQVNTLQPTLVIENSRIEPAATLQYEFEVYSDAAMTQQLVSELVNEDLGITTAYQVQFNLVENTRYYWRARAFDGVIYSEWVNSEFIVNNTEEAPGEFNINSPADGSEVSSATPTLAVTNSVDPDGDSLNYTFEVFADVDLTLPIAASEEITEGATGITSWEIDLALEENTIYYWRTTASDDTGLSRRSAVAFFFTNIENDAPTGIAIASPENGAEISENTVELTVLEASDPDNSSLMYLFEIDTVNTFDSANFHTSGDIDTPSYSVANLTEDTVYYWRARATDGFANSDWVSASFIVNTQNSAPPSPSIQNPGDQSWVATLLPTLSVNPVVDADNDAVSYRFEIFLDEAMTTLVTSNLTTETAWLFTEALIDNTWYYWRVRAEDDNAAVSAWSATSTFFVNENSIDDEPAFVFEAPAADLTVDNNSVELRWNDNDPDSSATISLYYDTDVAGEDGTLIVAGLSEDADESDDIYHWSTLLLENGDYYIYAVIADDSHSVVVYNNFTISVNNTPANQAPSILLQEPSADTELALGSELTITWLDSDVDNDASISLFYDLDNTGLDGELIASGISEDVDGASGSYVWDTTGLGAGSYYIYAVISDGENPEATSYATGRLTLSDNNSPEVTIDSPADAQLFTQGEAVTLSASAMDTEDGDISASIDWSSDRDGELGSGANLIVSALSAGTHEITATVTDSHSLTANASLTITINATSASLNTGALVPGTVPEISVDFSAYPISAYVAAQDFPATGDAVVEEEGATLFLSGNRWVKIDLPYTVTADTKLRYEMQVLSEGELYAAGFAANLERSADVTLVVGGTEREIWGTIVGEYTSGGEYQSFDVSVGDYITGDAPYLYFLCDADNDQYGSVRYRNVVVYEAGASAGEAYYEVLAGDTWQSIALALYGNSAVAPNLQAALGASYTLTAGVRILQSDLPTALSTEVPDALPQISIISPTTGSVVNFGGEIALEATAVDNEDGDLSNGIEWISSLDGVLSTGDSSVTLATLSLGTHTITASVTDSAGQTNTATIGLSVVDPTNSEPIVTISEPVDGAAFYEGELINLVASATDAEDGDISASIIWASDLDGELGTSANLETENLSIGRHLITATATDSGLAVGSAGITLDINASSVTLDTDALTPGEISGIAIDFNAYPNSAYGIDQDFPSSGEVLVEDDGATLFISGNRWRKIDLLYTVTSNTMLRYDIQVLAEAELYAAGFARELAKDPDITLVVDGIHRGVWGTVVGEYTAAGEYQTFDVNVGRYITGEVPYLYFLSDADDDQYGSVRYSNVIVYESDTQVGEAYYAVVAGDTWASVTQKLYGNADAAAHLQAELEGSYSLSVGEKIVQSDLPPYLSLDSDATE